LLLCNSIGLIFLNRLENHAKSFFPSLVQALCSTILNKSTMEKKQGSPHNAPIDNSSAPQSDTGSMIGKVDLSRSITENPGDGEGDRNDTSEMEALADYPR
jgi:hypothetical protein